MGQNSGKQTGTQLLGRYMKRRRRELGLSQQEVARRGGPSQAWQSDHENGKAVEYPRIPKASMLLRIAAAYGVPITEVEEATGLQRGATLPQGPSAPTSFDEVEGRVPFLLTTGDVVYLVPEDEEPKLTILAADAFFTAWRKGRNDER